jgi:hypothetical protein
MIKTAVRPTWNPESVNVIPQFEVQDDVIIEFMHNINIMTFPDEIIRTSKQTGQIMPLRNILRGPIEPAVPQLESWAVSVNGASEGLICTKQMTFGYSTG